MGLPMARLIVGCIRRRSSTNILPLLLPQLTNHRFLCSSEPPPPNPTSTRGSRTPLHKQFDSWIDRLKPGFTDSDLTAAIRAQSDPDLSLDIFRWATHSRTRSNSGGGGGGCYRPNSEVYHAILQLTISGRRYAHAESLINEIVSGACAEPDLQLYNAIVRFCCSRRHLFSRAFDVFKLMQGSSSASCRPSIETYSMLLAALVRRFDRSTVRFTYMHSVRSLVRQMKASGVVPDTLALNLVIKAHSRCLEMDEALRVFGEMRLHGCEPDGYTYGYIVRGMCEKGRVGDGLRFYSEMRRKKLVPTATVYMTLANGLSMAGRFEDAAEVVFDMIGSGKTPDLITYKTLLEGLCRSGKEDEAMRLLEEVRKRGGLDEKTHEGLLDGIRWLSQEF